MKKYTPVLNYDSLLPPILVIEDNDMDLDFCLQAFKAHAIENPVIACRDGDEAFAFIEDNPTVQHTLFPLLVLLDLRLPKVDGIDVLRYAQAHPIWKRVPFVVLSTSRENTDIGEAYTLGVSSYFVKPIDFPSFSAIVKQIKTRWIHPDKATIAALNNA